MSKNDKGTMSPQEQAQYAYDYNSPYGLSPEAKVIYERLVAEGGVARRPAEYTSATADPLAGIEQRSSAEARARILAMFKKANGKYAKPFSMDRLAWASVFGGNWEEYGQVVLQMAILDTLLSIEEKLDRLAGDQPGEQDTPS
jgi:hypothetical protein